MKYFKLIEPVHESQYLMVDAKAKGGNRRYERLMVVPGKVYEIPDDLYLNSIKNAPKGRIRYDAKFEQMLKDNGVEYTVKKCGSCGGGVKSIIYSKYEIIEVDDE